MTLNNLNPSELTFNVKHKILRIEGQKNQIIYQSNVEDCKTKYSIKWKVNRNDTNNIISSRVVKDIFVATYNRIHNEVKLTLCGLPRKKTKIDGFQIQWTLFIKECDLCYKNVTRFAFKQYPRISQDNFIDVSTFDMDDFKELDEFIIDTINQFMA